jgi:hypothetical protein
MIDDFLTHLDYETRNLGMSSYALTTNFLDNPDLERLVSALAERTVQSDRLFIQARVVPEQFFSLPTIETSGFSFVETTLDPYTVLGKNPVLQIFQTNPGSFVPRRFNLTAFGFKNLDKSDQTACESVKIIAAESFIKDRFHVDPRCPNHLADTRFVYWVEDLLSGDTLFLLLFYEDCIIGFMARKREHLILAGFSRKYSASGLGDYLWLSVLSDMLSEGLAQAHTRISTNNIPVLNLYARLGFKFRDPAAMFHYWHNR